MNENERMLTEEQAHFREGENKTSEPARSSMLSWKEMKPLNCPRAAELPGLVSQAGPQELLGTKTDFLMAQLGPI